MRYFSHPLQLVAGFMIWAIWFALMYGFLSAQCIDSPHLQRFNWINGFLLFLTLITTGLLSFLAFAMARTLLTTEKKDKPTRYFILWVGCCVYIVSALTTLFIGSMALFFPPCLSTY